MLKKKKKIKTKFHEYLPRNSEDVCMWQLRKETRLYWDIWNTSANSVNQTNLGTDHLILGGGVVGCVFPRVELFHFSFRQKDVIVFQSLKAMIFLCREEGEKTAAFLVNKYYVLYVAGSILSRDKRWLAFFHLLHNKHTYLCPKIGPWQIDTSWTTSRKTLRLIVRLPAIFNRSVRILSCSKISPRLILIVRLFATAKTSRTSFPRSHAIVPLDYS